MDFWKTLLDIFTLLAAALLLGMVFERLRQSAILGYLLAGILLGPGALNWISNKDALSAMAELGVALLLFTIGLEFSWKRLRALGAVATAGGTLQILLTGGAAAAAGLFGGLDLKPAIALGAMIALSSTASVLRMLQDRAELDSVHGRNSLGILLLQDIAVVPLVLLVTMLGTGGSFSQMTAALGRVAVLGLLFLGGLYLLSSYLLPRLLAATAITKNRELPILLAIAVCLGSAWAAHALELSPALGAFAAGLLLGESPYATQIRADVGPLRTMFVTLFFTSIGTLTDLAWAREHWPALVAAVVAIIAGKALLVWLVVRLFRHSHRHALATGICLAQVGEFSFVLAQSAWSSQIISPDLFRLVVSSTVITLFLTPFLVALAPNLARRVEKRLVWLGLVAIREHELALGERRLSGHVIVVGFGPAGQGVLEALNRAGILALLVELNPRTVATARQQGILAEVGDASAEPVLAGLEVAAARAVAVTVPDHRTALLIIRQVRALAPHVPIIARARYHVYAEDLRSSGAHIVVDEEREIGGLLGQAVMRCLQQHPPSPDSGQAPSP
jgi:CPA2 family monovalent cation:H+ antiporter-2